LETEVDKPAMDPGEEFLGYLLPIVGLGDIEKYTLHCEESVE